ncbi:AzlD domain-containing protein [Cryptobacterium curtum]|uniref:AzlD domain-containing protein n=1 Tax=Cryptobacterium curtum TaxID=84163 RepID=UPI0028D1C92A|nr:AzlD domain-containing protein [Cryptobacterium curtum]
MTVSSFLLVYGICLATMLICRCVPLFALKGRELSADVRVALELIPPAAFAALVANDLFKPSMFDAGIAASMVPLVSAALVVIVAWRTHSLIGCACAGIVAYALLAAFFGM